MHVPDKQMIHNLLFGNFLAHKLYDKKIRKLPGILLCNSPGKSHTFERK
jgi:hypothetical protein